jgi:protein-L-isoaspartate(D-aspartate) O-methyltransferase
MKRIGICLMIGAMGACNLGLASSEDSLEAQALREELVSDLSTRVHSKYVLDALRRVPRHLFVPGVALPRAYANIPLPIGHGQTISQPEVIALMTEALALRGPERVLEVGTGSGYQAAILSVLAKDVYTIEIIPELGETARRRFARLRYTNVRVLVGDGYRGWPDHAPFDRILLTAAPPTVPHALLDQLVLGGVLVAPVGPSPWNQRLMRYTKNRSGTTEEDLGLVAFVPMVPGDVP